MVGQTLSHYKVLEEIGRGGMGVVYRALDIKLNREVALKVLPAELVANPERKRRFIQEAQATAALKHPNIAVIYEIDDADDVTFIAMELIEGQKLSDVLAREQPPLSRTLSLAVEVTDGLSRAHDKGIVHRDLKPTNIMVTDDGHAKIIDFGLAKLIEPLGKGESELETAVKAETQAGRVMGTLAYMSPEQARGQNVDHRSDTFSFGIVLYEMLTGRLPFQAQSAAEMPHAIIHDQPAPLGDSVSGVTAPELRRILNKCLSKDPADRYQTVRDLFIDLRGVKRDSESQPEVVTTVDTPSLPSSKRKRWLIPGAAAALLVLVVLEIVYWRSEPDSPMPRVISTTQLTHEPGLEADPAISPDGKMVAYAKGAVGQTKLYVQQITGGRPVALTEDFPGAHYRPRWSPDGSQIAFSADFSVEEYGIYVVPALGGAPRRIVDQGWGLVWAPDGARFAYLDRDLYRGSVAGGQAVKIASTTAAEGLSWSPDGEKIVYTQGNGYYLLHEGLILNLAHSSLWTVSPEGDDPACVSQDDYLDNSPVWTPDSKYILFASNRGGSRDIYRIAVGPSGTPTGEPQRLTTGLNVHSISLSEDGKRLAYSVLTMRQNIWSLPTPVDGPVSVTETPVTTENQAIEGIDVSPDGQWLVFDSNRSGNQDIYKMPIEGGELIQLTTDPADDFLPAWSPDGKDIVFYSFRTGNRDIHVMTAEGGSVRQLTSHPGPDHYPNWSPDGKHIVFQSRRSERYQLYVLSADAGELAGEESRLLTTEGGGFAKWSPDSRWIAFARSGAIFLISPEGGEVTPLVQREGGAYTVWSPDGGTVYYKRSGIWSVPVSGGEPKLLVQFDDPERQTFRAEWAAGAGRFFFTLTEHESDVWVMELETEGR